VGIDLADLPSDVAALQALVRRFAEAVNAQELKIAQLEARIARLKRMQFGRSSEKIVRDIEQLELELDELHEDDAERAAKRPTPLKIWSTSPVANRCRPIPAPFGPTNANFLRGSSPKPRSFSISAASARA
jgi:transposase